MKDNLANQKFRACSHTSDTRGAGRAGLKASRKSRAVGYNNHLPDKNFLIFSIPSK